MRRHPSERFVAWLVTGPAGHLWSVVADVVELWGRYLLSRLRERV